MKSIDFALSFGLVTALLFGGACAGENAGEADRFDNARARTVPGAGSAVLSFGDEEFVGSFRIEVVGDSVRLLGTGWNANGALYLWVPVAAPEALRAEDGTIAYAATAAAGESVGAVSTSGSGRSDRYEVSRIDLSTDATGRVLADLTARRAADVDADGYAVPGTGGELVPLGIRGHLTGDCSVRMADGTVLLDPERTANPLCRELLDGL